MESQPQNHEFRNNPENFHLCILEFWPVLVKWGQKKSSILKKNHLNVSLILHQQLENIQYDIYATSLG